MKDKDNIRQQVEESISQAPIQNFKRDDVCPICGGGGLIPDDRSYMLCPCCTESEDGLDEEQG